MITIVQIISSRMRRKYLVHYLRDDFLVLKCRISKFRGKRFLKILEELDILLRIKFNEDTDQLASIEQNTLIHYDKIKKFQSILFNNYQEDL